MWVIPRAAHRQQLTERKSEKEREPKTEITLLIITIMKMTYCAMMYLLGVNHHAQLTLKERWLLKSMTIRRWRYLRDGGRFLLSVES